jgi:hypothetical protein
LIGVFPSAVGPSCCSMTDVEPPSRSHRPFIAIGALAALLIMAASIVFITRTTRAEISARRSLSLLVNLPALNAKTRFSIDSVTAGPSSYVVTGVQPQIVIHPGTSLTVTGWAVDDGAKSPGKGVHVAVDGGPAITAAYGMLRHDVARKLEDQRLAASGFIAVIPTDGLSAGQHELTFEIVNAAGTGVYHVPERIQFTVRPS